MQPSGIDCYVLKCTITLFARISVFIATHSPLDTVISQYFSDAFTGTTPVPQSIEVKDAVTPATDPSNRAIRVLPMIV